MKVLKFYSPCCGQCKVLAREFKEHPLNAPIKEVDVTEQPELADKYNVRGLPTTILVDYDNNVVETWHGIVKSEVINNKIAEYLPSTK